MLFVLFEIGKALAPRQRERQANMKTSILIAAMATIAWPCSTAHACDPPDVGDQFHYKNGPLLEVVKVKDAMCNVKLCVRPVGFKQPCHWVADPRIGVPGLGETWVIMNGADQITKSKCDPSVGFIVGCEP